MFTSIEIFKSSWQRESENTMKVFETLTPESLSQKVAEGHRDLGRLAWHIALTIGEMCNRTGLKVKGPEENDPMPATLEEIISGYRTASKTLIEEIDKNWNDATLMQEDDMYGMQWKRGVTLDILMKHEIHHRGQMTVLMRQAGLKVPGVCGPSYEEWQSFGAPPPEI